MTRNERTTLILIAALAFLIIAALIGANRADAAATSQRVNTTVLTHAVSQAQTTIWLHNIHKARSTRTNCAFHNYVGVAPHAFGDVWVCTTRIYRHSDHTGRLATVRLKILMVPRYPDGRYYEDGSGWAIYPLQPHETKRRSVYMNVLRVTG